MKNEKKDKKKKAGERERDKLFIFIFIILPDHEHHLQHHRIDLLKEDLYHDMNVEHQVKPRNRRDHLRQRSF
jgi:hypothetical protein